MNARLISTEAKIENRRMRDRRRRLKKVNKRRMRLLAQIENQPQVLALLESGLVSDRDVLRLCCGRLDQVREAIRKIHLAVAMLNSDEVATPYDQIGGADQPRPDRLIHRSNRGIPTDADSFWSTYHLGILRASALRRMVSLPGTVNSLAYFDSQSLDSLLPGIKIPLRLQRLKYLIGWHSPGGAPQVTVYVYSITGKALFRHPIPPDSPTRFSNARKIPRKIEDNQSTQSHHRAIAR